MAEGGRIQVALQYHCSLYVDDDHPVFHGIFCPPRQSRKILFLFPVNLRGNHGRISVRQLFTLFLFFEIMGLTSFVMVIQEETEAAGGQPGPT